MARVFLSYARENAGEAQALAEAIDAAGHTVWWDRHVHGGLRFADEIDRELKEADVVVVLWSQDSIGSAWVQDEAAEGRDSGRLVPVKLDACKPPLGFRQYQTLDLSGDLSGSETPSLQELLHAIASTAGEDPSTAAAKKGKKAPPARQYSICVLPFANMSGEFEQEYFSDGISEDIITDLTKISALSVVARNTAFTFKDKPVRVTDVARELNVSHVLEGSVRKSGGRVRITAQLIDGAAGDHIWAERYDRELTDIFAIQDEISSAIVGALKLKLLPQEKKAIEQQRGTNNSEAYDLYLMAREYWISGNYGDTRRDQIILRLCKSAVEIDPDYARAWALMALVQADMRYQGSELVENGIAAAEKALELNPDLAEPHGVKAKIFTLQGRHDEASAEIAIAVELDPDSWDVNREAAMVMFRQDRIAEAAPFFARAAELVETDCRSLAMLICCYRGLGDLSLAEPAARLLLERVERAVAQDKSNGAALAIGANALAELGESDRAREWMRRALLVDPDNRLLLYNLACACLAPAMNDNDTAIDLLRPYMTRANAGQMLHLAADPDLDPLRDDPRFKAMLADAEARIAAAEV
ncbi:MAG: TIR domain-containing protein [Sphingomicrobium sp.]